MLTSLEINHQDVCAASLQVSADASDQARTLVLVQVLRLVLGPARDRVWTQVWVPLQQHIREYP